MNLQLNWLTILVFVSVVIYFAYDFFESRRPMDEREELIKLKTFEFVQKMMTFSLLVLSISYFFIQQINGQLILCILIFSSLYSEILAKIYFRKQF